jgi:hypothetical protein
LVSVVGKKNRPLVAVAVIGDERGRVQPAARPWPNCRRRPGQMPANWRTARSRGPTAMRATRSGELDGAARNDARARRRASQQRRHGSGRRVGSRRRLSRRGRGQSGDGRGEENGG